MHFFSTTVARATRTGKTYTTFNSGHIPASNFSVAPHLHAAFECEDEIDIEASASLPDSAPKRNAAKAELDGVHGSAKRGRTAVPAPTPAVGSTPPAPKASSALKRTLRNQSRHRSNKTKKKDDDFISHGQQPQVGKANITHQSATPLPHAINFDALPASSSGYEAKTKGSSGSKAHKTLAQVMKEKPLEYVPWDGVTPILFTDPNSGRVGLAGVGQPNHPGYVRSHNAACEAILQAGLGANLNTDHKRGRGFGALNVGILQGHGPRTPYNLRNDGNEEMLEELLKNPDIIRVATFQSGEHSEPLYCLHASHAPQAALSTFFPKLYAKYHSLRVDVEDHLPNLKWNFKRSVFSAAAFNFGPQVVTSRHRDCMNLPAGFCAITALGNFDSEKGGHLIVEELGIVIEFPAGSCILLPSAVFTHYNTSVQPGEIRLSFTQFSSGGLFRFADNGYRTQEDLKKYDEGLYNYMMERKKTRWERDLALWSTMEELLENVNNGEDDEDESDEE
ncbi:hypothetical protein DFP72DRAFT_844797 [Ephemerocybe angulata]|uniref:Uncharacterized protein n=1 Tax=Ephemerocybe angulata TaxID=980116 RepID=A0A8H6M7T0_9AGAR|nr:hypothetical protein DFP72DRAFT_844797 [Tulosesus angulatus]